MNPSNSAAMRSYVARLFVEAIRPIPLTPLRPATIYASRAGALGVLVVINLLLITVVSFGVVLASISLWWLAAGVIFTFAVGSFVFLLSPARSVGFFRESRQASVDSPRLAHITDNRTDQANGHYSPRMASARSGPASERRSTGASGSTHSTTPRSTPYKNHRYRWVFMLAGYWVPVLTVVALFAVHEYNSDLSRDNTRGAIVQTGAQISGSAPLLADPVAAEDTLESQADTDYLEAVKLFDKWAPQIFSVRPGLAANGVVYDSAKILQSVNNIKARYPQAILVSSDLSSSFISGGFWVVLVPPGFDTAEQANAWCDSEGLPAADCFAKRMKLSEGPKGNNVYR